MTRTEHSTAGERLRAGWPALLLLPLLGGCAAAVPTAAPIPAPVATPAPVVAAPPVARRPAGTFAFSGTARQGGLLLGTAPPDTVTVTLDGAAVAMAPDRRFLVGFGRDAGPTALVEARLREGRVVRHPLAVAPRQWDVQSLPTLPRGTTPTPAFLARRGDERARIAAARALKPASEGWRGPFRWPVTGRISGVFGSQRIYAGEPGAPHSGVDIARPTGTPVAAPADAVVVLAADAPFTLEGNLLILDHGMGLSSAFLHLDRIDVKPGQVVRAGQPVGAIGRTGRATGPHLHWGMVWNGVRIDPQALVPPMPSGPVPPSPR